MAEEVSTPIHPSKCPKCKRKWTFESQIAHQCEYCHHRLNEGIAYWFFDTFAPMLVYLGLAFAIFKALGN